MPSHSDQNKRAYNLWAEIYDQYPNPTVAMDDRFFPAFYGSVAGAAVLEVGCGTGRHTVRLAREAASVTGVDPSAGMLAQARRKLPPAVTLLEGDFLELSFQKRAFDVVLESLVLEHVGELQRFFTQAHGALKPGGVLYLSELHPVRLARGTKAHFKDPASGAEIETASHAHRAEDFLRAAEGFALVETRECLGDEALAGLKPGWEKYLGMPMIQMWKFRRK